MTAALRFYELLLNQDAAGRPLLLRAGMTRQRAYDMEGNHVTTNLKSVSDATVVQGLRDLADSYDELDDSAPQYSAAKWAIAYRARELFRQLEATVELGIMMRTLDDRGELAPVRAALAAGNEAEAKRLMFDIIG